MKNYIYIIVILSIVTFTGCKSTSQQKKTSCLNQFDIIIDDYFRKDRNDFKKYSMFSIKYHQMENKEYYFYDILPMKDKSYRYAIDANPEQSYLPSSYIKFKDKVFFVEDENVRSVKKDLLDYLDSLELLDSTTVKLQLGMIQSEQVEIRMDRYEDLLEGVTYIFCKKDPYTIRKRIRSSSYIPPDDKRFENLCE